MTNEYVFLIPLKPSEYPFSRAPLMKFEGKTLLEICILKLIQNNISPNLICVIGSDEEALYSISRFGAKIIKTANEINLLEEIETNETLSSYSKLVVLSIYFIDFDLDFILSLIEKSLTTKQTHIMGIGQNNNFHTSEHHLKIATIYDRNQTISLNKLSATYITQNSQYHIQSLKDLWTLEQLKKRKHLIFNVEAYTEIGLGHIYRCLAIASHLQDFDISFICSKKSIIVQKMTLEYGFKVKIFDDAPSAHQILEMNPSLVINDILNTTFNFVNTLKSSSRVINFEDLGEGAREADVTFNDLYESDGKSPSNILWGHSYYFLREEFELARPNHYRGKLRNILITFGGTDPNNLTLHSLNAVLNTCIKFDIGIYIVTGSGYQWISQLNKAITEISWNKIKHIHKTGVISSIMEDTEFAICSNGRTTFELAHMHVPAIIVCHHEREASHSFAREENGFINLGVFDKTKTAKLLESKFIEVSSNDANREKLFLAMELFDFRPNKKHVLDIIRNTLGS